MKILCVAVIMLVLAGCATTKPELSAQDAEVHAVYWFSTHKCNEAGKLSPELAAFGIRYLSYNLSKYSYDSIQLDTRVQQLARTAPPVTDTGCNRLALLFAENKQKWDNNKSDSHNSDFNKHSVKPSNTYCNKIGTQLFCNTY